MKEKILITGASGFIGLQTTLYFLEKGIEVVALVRKNTIGVEHPNLQVVKGDMRDISSLKLALKGVLGVVHLAGAKSDENDSFEVNVTGAKNLVEAGKAEDVKFIINISTASTKIKQKGLYGETKNQADKIFLESGIPTTILKPSVVYGDLKNGVFGSIYKFTKLPFTPIFGDGECLFRPIYVGDLAHIIYLSCFNQILRGKTYDIGGPDLVSFNSLVYLIGEKILEKKALVIHIPKRAGLALATLLSYIFSKPPITKSNILGSTQSVEMDFDTYSKDFNFKPISIYEGLDLLKKKEIENREAVLMLNYVSSRSIPKISITEREIQLYNKVREASGDLPEFSNIVYKLPILVGLLDFASIFHKKGALFKKMHIASVILECSPNSFEWLVPQSKSVFKIFAFSTYLTLSFFIKAILSFPMLLFPKFIKRNVI